MPVVALPSISIPSQTVYVDYNNGNDANNGSYTSPKKTFSAAIALINFGVTGINNGNNDGEIVIKQGTYYLKNNDNFNQAVSDWRKLSGSNYVYKNVSIRGEGNVVLYGDSLSANLPILKLIGNGIKVSNLKIFNAPSEGIYILGSAINPHQNIWIDSVDVQFAKQSGVLITGFNKVMVQNSIVNNNCMINSPSGNGACSWPSGLRSEDCNNLTFQKNIVAKNWGEGLNNSYVKYAKIIDNKVFDNYSVNVYCHSTSSAIYSHNLVYNSDSAYWRYCWGSGGKSADGISIANELSCTTGCGIYTNPCGSILNCCSHLDFDNSFYQNVNYFQTDSVYIFNNILLNANLDIWDAFSTIFNNANLSNFFISNNSIVGVSGNASINKSVFNLSLGTQFVNFKNININANIFSVDTNSSKNSTNLFYVPNGTCNGGWQSQISFNFNNWIKKPTLSSINFSNDIQTPSLPQNISPSNLNLLVPSTSNTSLISTYSLPSYITDDYFHYPRLSNTNVGAIEYNSTMDLKNILKNKNFIYPNPVNSQLYFSEKLNNQKIEIIDILTNKIITSNIVNGNFYNVSALSNGIYILKIYSNYNIETHKFEILK